MIKQTNFVRVTSADFIVRAAYQMGKTPLLPLFAASLGAGELLLGFIVSVSTLTGMISKPLVGFLSDRWGRRIWLLIGTAFFSFVPFLYWFVTNPTQLIVIRILHGTATAIYGPVTLALVAELTNKKRAEKLGWFSNAKSAGYVVGPAVGGFLLLFFPAQMVFTIIGLISCLAFIPVLGIQETVVSSGLYEWKPSNLLKAIPQLFSWRYGAIWLAGGIDAISYIALYALRAFLPIFAFRMGFNSAEIGTFFTFQETAAIIAKPAGGRLSDRTGSTTAIMLSMLGISLVLPLVPMADQRIHLLLLAIMLGACQGVLFPATMAMIAEHSSRFNLGTSMGMAGTLANAGKVIGPLTAGFMLAYMSYQQLFVLLALGLFLTALMLFLMTDRQKPELLEGVGAD